MRYCIICERAQVRVLTYITAREKCKPYYGEKISKIINLKGRAKMAENTMIDEAKDVVVKTLDDFDTIEDCRPKTSSGMGPGIGMLIGAGIAVAAMVTAYFVTKKKSDGGEHAKRLKRHDSEEDDEFEDFEDDAVDVDYEDCEDEED